MPASTPDNQIPPGMLAGMPGRPHWSASEAARRCGVGRATIQRALTAGRIPGAAETEKGWSIPLEGLLAAGFFPDRPTAPDQSPSTTPDTDREHDRAPATTNSEHARRIAELEQALDLEHARADLEHAHRIAAEQLAAERAERVADLRHALRMIEAAPQTPEPPEAAPPTTPPAPNPHRWPRFLNRVLDR
ncbi:PhoU domain-containing protein [Rhodococcus marinonascens]|uniref:PhoU domain-containing protein n=1 Tax=Rhodococcus marinonascens TaxID=38311 RepID=UPI000934AF37|nr:PhoU domain-containing protein [Rhodococcus marinonascens]